MALVDDTSIFEDVLAIAGLPAQNVHFRYRLELWVNGEPYEAVKVLSINTRRVFVEDFSDVTMIEAVVGLGTYSHILYPNKQSLTAKLYRQAVLPAAGGKDQADIPEESWDYECILTGEQSPTVVSGTEATSDVETGDRSDVVAIEAQLIAPVMDDFRTVEVGGIFRNATIEQVIRTLYSNITQPETPPGRPTVESQDYVDGVLRNAIAGCDIVTPDNDTTYDHIVIPHGTRLVDVPGYLQKVYGVYNTGVGQYFQYNIWFIYPMFNTQRFSEVEANLTIANIAANRMPGTEKSYRVDEPLYYGKTYILATGDVVQKDVTEQLQLNVGNGYRAIDAGNIIDAFTVTSANVSTIGEHRQEAMVENRNGTNFVRMSDRVINSNTFVDNTRLSKQIGTIIQLRWDNSNIELVYPGMPLKLLYIKDGEVESLLGVLHSVEEYSSVIEASMSENRHVRNAVLTVFVERDKQD